MDLAPTSEVFCLPHDGKYIVYAPLKGLIFLTNGSFVNLLCRARDGDAEALARLGVEREVAARLFGGPAAEPRRADEPADRFAPTAVTLCLTDDCTMRCSYCYASGGSSRARMPWDTVTGVLSEIAANARGASRAMTVHFHGGGDASAAWDLLVESRRHLRETAEADGVAVRTSIGSNGVLSDPQRRWLIENIDEATLSIDGPAFVQDVQRPLAGGRASFPIVDRTLRTLDDAGFRYGIRATVTAESVTHLAESVAFLCGAYAARRIKVEPMFPRGRGADPTLRPPDATAFVEHFRRARAIAAAHGRELIYSGARLGAVTSAFCQASGQSCAVTPAGWVSSCYEVLSPDDPLAGRFLYGRYDRERRTLVVDEGRRRALADLSVLQRPECARCFCKWTCAGDCPAKALSSADPALERPDRCTITRALTLDQLVAAVEAPEPGRHATG